MLILICFFFILKIVDEDQIDFIKAFNKLSEEEKQKYLANLTDEQRAAILKMQETYEA